MATTTRSLRDELSTALPNTFRCRIRYVHSPPKACEPLFAPLPGTEPEKTRLANHFLTASIKPKQSTDGADPSDVLFLGLEMLVYSTKRLTTIFVSKADSTGYLPQERPSAVKTIITTFLRWLADRERQKHPRRKLVISLFARSQSQYLFPGSAETAGKHVLDDRQLIKWWARVLDPIFPTSNGDFANGKTPDCEGFITVPGYEKSELRQFMPPNATAAGQNPRWKPGNPLPELATTRGVAPTAPPRCLLPRFPDDPKARFMQDLDDEVGITGDATTTSPSKRKSGKWNTIRDLDRFWEAMEFRQECSSGRVVGFLWLVLRPAQSEQQAINGASQDSAAELGSDDIPANQREETPTPTTRSPIKRRRKPLTGPIIPRQPRLKGGSSSLTANSDLSNMVDSHKGDGVTLSKDAYDKAMQTLLHLEFGTLEAAAKSTTKWVSEVSTLVGVGHEAWAMDIEGTKRIEVPPATANGVVVSSNGVNDLGSMVRKKRKTDDDGGEQRTTAEAEKTTVNVLGAGMVRKKAKVAS